ncbi:MAG: M20/M25/M40 family metallo-hydrolase [Bacteroidia bacterium]
MKQKLLLTAAFIFLFIPQTFSQNNDSLIIRKLYNEALANGKAYGWLDYLSNNIGGRLSGSLQAAQAVKWGEMILGSIKTDRVFKQQCMVPHWVRGAKEKAYIVKGDSKTEVPVCALGNSIATPKGGLTAEVVEVRSWDELPKLGSAALKGKIVFYNFEWDQTKINTFDAYGQAVEPRWAGAQRAAPYGAVGVVVRSAASVHDNNPHTGSMGYIDSIPKIPACAISTNAADQLSRDLKFKSGVPVKFSFTQNCEMLPDTVSFNVLAEIKGSEHPEEIITVGGHLDSWDTGHGAHDDGAGVVQSAEVLNLFKALGLQPKRTIRCVFFMNEENGGRGGKEYAEQAKKLNEKLIAAIETDAGGFVPRGFSFDGDSVKINKIRSWQKLFKPYNIYSWDGSGSGSDIGHLADQCPVLIGLSPDSQRYFEIHHTTADTFDKVNQRELELGAATMAALVYLISEYGL